MAELKQEVTRAVSAQALPTSVITGSIIGVPINTLILWATLLYLVLQIIVILPKVKGVVTKGGKKRDE